MGAPGGVNKSCLSLLYQRPARSLQVEESFLDESIAKDMGGGYEEGGTSIGSWSWTPVKVFSPEDRHESFVAVHAKHCKLYMCMCMLSSSHMHQAVIA